MPVSFSIKEVPDALAEQLRQQARRNYRSVQGELMAIIEGALTPARPSIAEKTVTEKAKDEARLLDFVDDESSVAIIRATRDGFPHLPDALAERLRRRAERNRRTLQGELRAIIEAAEPEEADAGAEPAVTAPIAELLAELRALGPGSPSESTEIVRTMRDMR